MCSIIFNISTKLILLNDFTIYFATYEVLPETWENLPIKKLLILTSNFHCLLWSGSLLGTNAAIHVDVFPWFYVFLEVFEVWVFKTLLAILLGSSYPQEIYPLNRTVNGKFYCQLSTSERPTTVFSTAPTRSSTQPTLSDDFWLPKTQ